MITLEKEKAKVFDIKKLPMDLARFFLLPLTLLAPIRKLDCDLQRYKTHLTGPYVIVSNHTGFLDPILMTVCFWYRRVHFWASEEVMTGFRAKLLSAAGCIRVDRKAFDIQAIRSAVQVLKDEKRIVAVYPQGQIQNDDQISQVKSGAILIALKAGVPILPVYIPKKKHLFCRRTAIIGKPLSFETFYHRTPALSDIDALAGAMLDGLNACANAYQSLNKE